MTNAAPPRHQVGRDNIRPFGLDIHNPVFVVSSLTSIVFVAGALLFRDAAGGAFEALYAWLTSTFDWMFMAAANIFLLFCLALLPTRLGRIRLGGPDARPEYSNWSWFAMLFAAGIGIGLLFFGVAEPVTHFLNPPLGMEAAEGLAVAATLYHWGLHGWAIYAVAALALAFAAYNLGLPMSLRSAFYPGAGQPGVGPIRPCRGHPRRVRDGLRTGDLARPGRRADGSRAGPTCSASPQPIRPRYS